MGMFQITKDLVSRVLNLIDGGLIHGAGTMGGSQVCVQQAVSLATGQPKANDQPSHCVLPWIVALGVNLNDASGWESDESRAEGMKPFAVSELGSNQLREGSFRRKLAEKASEKWSGLTPMSVGYEFVEQADDDGEEGLLALIKMTVEVLTEMKCPGTDYLCMVDKKEYEKPEDFGSIPRIKAYTPEQRKAAWVPEDAPWNSLGGKGG